ncbi:hypothetical protein EGR_09942 [Echinococcus granulosus]|uniref:Uncharacterized protein n=1 Tax=Echinococcus granulosus TaxID=6210 RepID=W6U3P0_ECHGR|nr:hypothetical protein EGR_09942 [Echinococcus granulosus]EUB55201.1 hypothetical protein EGR_09942 [Echinococcus granulosus]
MQCIAGLIGSIILLQFGNLYMYPVMQLGDASTLYIPSHLMQSENQLLALASILLNFLVSKLYKYVVLGWRVISVSKIPVKTSPSNAPCCCFEILAWEKMDLKNMANFMHRIIPLEHFMFEHTSKMGQFIPDDMVRILKGISGDGSDVWGSSTFHDCGSLCRNTFKGRLINKRVLLKLTNTNFGYQRYLRCNLPYCSEMRLNYLVHVHCNLLIALSRSNELGDIQPANIYVKMQIKLLYISTMFTEEYEALHAPLQLFGLCGCKCLSVPPQSRCRPPFLSSSQTWSPEFFDHMHFGYPN